MNDSVRARNEARDLVAARARAAMVDVEYISREDLAAAWTVHDRIVERVERLIHFPELGPPGRLRGTRQLVITGTPYVVVYQLTKDEVLVVAVWHNSQSRRRRRLH